MSQEYFEFLASQPEWEDSCRKNEKNIDKIPNCFSAARKGERSWTFPAQLLTTLTVWEQIANSAKNGSSKDESVKGYPGLVDGIEFYSEKSSERKWGDFIKPDPTLLDSLPDGSLLLSVDVRLKTPFYSRDDSPFYPTDNILKRHRVFDAPYLAAGGVKGLLRWAYCMSKKRLTEDTVAKQLFGTDTISDTENKENAGSVGLQGALWCYPVFWEGRIGLETINPQDRQTGAGTNPIKYEVITSGGKGTLYFLLANLPKRELSRDLVSSFLSSLEWLLTYGGLSAKSTAGWGSVQIERLNAAVKNAILPKTDREVQQEEEERIKKEKAAEEERKNKEKELNCKQDAEKILSSIKNKITDSDVQKFSKSQIKTLLGISTDVKYKKMKGQFAQLLEKERQLLLEKQIDQEPAEQKIEDQEVPSTEIENVKHTEWLWKGKYIKDYKEFSDIVLQVMFTKERR